MNPILSVGIYLIMVLLAVAGVELCLHVLCGRGKADGRQKVQKRLRGVFYPVLAVLTALPIAGAFLPDSRIKFALTAAGNIWLGFFLYFFGCLLLLFLLYLVVSAFTHRMARAGAALVLALSLAAAVGIASYGMVHARQTKVVRYSVSLGEAEGQGTQEKSYKVVLLADLHLSVNSSLPMIQNMVELSNAQEPDAIVIAGDVFTSTYEGLRDPDAYAAVLRTLKAKDGVYLVAGNHDVEETLFGGFPISPISEAFRTEQMARFFTDCGFTLLDDELADLADGEIILAGRLDGEKAGDGTTNRKSAQELLAGADTAKPVLVLEHEPLDFQELKEAGADLALCGHTHNGQMFPGNLIIPFFNSNPYGMRTVDGLQTIVTAGVGFYGPPMRVGTDSEVTVVEITY